jgi:hypothetical protein
MNAMNTPCCNGSSCNQGREPCQTPNLCTSPHPKLGVIDIIAVAIAALCFACSVFMLAKIAGIA